MHDFAYHTPALSSLHRPGPFQNVDDVLLFALHRKAEGAGSLLVAGVHVGAVGEKQILDAAEEAEADVIATPCPLCQQNVEMYQDKINKEFGTDYRMPVVFHTQIMAVAFGMDAKKDAALDRNTIPADRLAGMEKT